MEKENKALFSYFLLDKKNDQYHISSTNKDKALEIVDLIPFIFETSAALPSGIGGKRYRFIVPEDYYFLDGTMLCRRDYFDLAFGIHRKATSDEIYKAIETELCEMNDNLNILHSDRSISTSQASLNSLAGREVDTLDSDVDFLGKHYSDEEHEFSIESFKEKVLPVVSYFFRPENTEIKLHKKGRKLVSEGLKPNEVLAYFSPFMNYFDEIKNRTGSNCFVAALCEFYPHDFDNMLPMPKIYYHVVSEGDKGVFGGVYSAEESGSKLAEIVKRYQSYSLTGE